MGLSDNQKYHVTDEGFVYRVNDDGSFTELGNVENIASQTAKDPEQDVTHNNVGKTEPGRYSVKTTSVRYSLEVMEDMLCHMRGRGLNKAERSAVAKNSRNYAALDAFIDFAGVQHHTALIRRFEKGEDFIEPLLLKIASQDIPSVIFLERLAACKKTFSICEITALLQNSQHARVRYKFAQNPLYRPNLSDQYIAKNQSPPQKGGCLGVIVLAFISAITLTSLIIL